MALSVDPAVVDEDVVILDQKVCIRHGSVRKLAGLFDDWANDETNSPRNILDAQQCVPIGSLISVVLTGDPSQESEEDLFKDEWSCKDPLKNNKTANTATTDDDDVFLVQKHVQAKETSSPGEDKAVMVDQLLLDDTKSSSGCESSSIEFDADETLPLPLDLTVVGEKIPVASTLDPIKRLDHKGLLTPIDEGDEDLTISVEETWSREKHLSSPAEWAPPGAHPAPRVKKQELGESLNEVSSECGAEPISENEGREQHGQQSPVVLDKPRRKKRGLFARLFSCTRGELPDESPPPNIEMAP